MLKRLLICSIYIILFSSSTLAQWKSERCNTYTYSDTIVLDSFSVIGSSIELDVKYKFDTFKNAIVLNEKKDSITVCYQIIPYQLNNPKSKRSLQELDSAGIIFSSFSTEREEEFFATPGIEKSGVISRGVSFGNNQDVFVNSNMNLQLQGNISNDVKLTATISDQNIPIQPEGNTQQLQEFDRIYLELEHSRWKLQAGDIWLKNKKESYFMNYNKRVQGGMFNVGLFEDTNYISNTYAGASLARGKFFSQLINSIEGVQGPYRLNGANGEKFIIIIANSEKVFLDGKELERGFNYDYTIDYNTGEIIFNNTIVITKFSRIRVDFEYTERNFTRSVINTGHQQKIGNLDLYYEFFTERDHPNQPILTDLTNEDYQVLSLIGDSLNNAFIDGARFSDTSSQIKYKRDIIGFDTVYTYSTNEDSAKYIVTFSEVGVGKGDYQIDLVPVNGRVYKYVGKGFGNYLPVRLLPVPNKREMMTIGSKWNTSKNSNIYSEIALSNKDDNVVSEINNSDNQGLGVRVGYEINKKKLNSKLNYSSNLEYQYTSQSFRTLDRIRNADFQRDWNENIDNYSEDNIVLSKIQLDNRNGNYYSLENNFRNKQNDVFGFQNLNKWNQSYKGFNFNGSTFFMNNETNNQKAEWRKITVNPNYSIGILKQGYRLNVEKNRLLNQNDSVVASQMNFEEHNFYLQNTDTASVQFLLNYQTRNDYRPIKGVLNWFEGVNNNLWNDKAKTYSANLKKTFNSSQNLSLTGTYRELQTKLIGLSGNDSLGFENNLLGRIDWNSNYFKRHISSEVTYTVNSSRELKREFQYVKWDNYSTATHVWKDNNNDGVEDLDEFFPILNNETQNTFVKFILPTSEYITAFSNNLNYRLNLKGPSGWKTDRGLKSFVSRFDNISILSTSRKSTENDINSRLNPFIGLFDTINLTDVNVLLVQKSLRSTLFFNRTNSKYGFDLTKTSLATKQLITNGTDSRLQDGWDFNSRINLTRYLSLNTLLSTTDKFNFSSYLITRNYEINEKHIKEVLAIQPTSTIRFTVNYSYILKNGKSVIENSKAEINKTSLDVKLNQLSKRTVLASIGYISINYNGEINTPMAYEIMEGLQKGNNYTWQLNLQQRLSNGLNVNVIYEGRKSELNQTIHTGRMQVSALF